MTPLSPQLGAGTCQNFVQVAGARRSMQPYSESTVTVGDMQGVARCCALMYGRCQPLSDSADCIAMSHADAVSPSCSRNMNVSHAKVCIYASSSGVLLCRAVRASRSVARSVVNNTSLPAPQPHSSCSDARHAMSIEC